jgi:hypothetical protein
VPQAYFSAKKVICDSPVDPAFPYRVANDLMRFTASSGSGWTQVTPDQAGHLADRGILVIGGLVNPTGSDHVLVVMPGPTKPDGGFMYQGFRLRSHGMFPPAL